jgi:hypothetical protein
VNDDHLLMVEKKQVLHTDIMHIDGKKFLISLSMPLYLTMQCIVERETASVIGLALQGQLELLHSKDL